MAAIDPSRRPPRERSGSRRRVSARVFEFWSGLVDLVVCVRHHDGGGHRLTLAGERFVGRLAEQIAQMGDRGAELGNPQRGERIERETGDGGRRLVTSQLIQGRGEGSQNGTHVGGATRVVVVADGHSGLFERGQGVAILDLAAGQSARQVGLVGAIAAVSCDHQAPPQSVTRAVRIGVAQGEPVLEKRK